MELEKKFTTSYKPKQTMKGITKTWGALVIHWKWYVNVMLNISKQNNKHK